MRDKAILPDEIPQDHPCRKEPERYSKKAIDQVSRYPYMVPSKCEEKYGVLVRYQSDENRGTKNTNKSLFYIS